MTNTANDPTMSGTHVETVAGGPLSRNEIESLCLKAARGAGLSWGMAEEAGYAAAWLEARGLDGAYTLLTLLDLCCADDWAAMVPTVEDRDWRAKGAKLCPLAVGAALSDFRAVEQADVTVGPLRFDPVSHPLLLLPFVAVLADRSGAAVQLKTTGGACAVGPDGVVRGDIAACAMRSDVVLSIEIDQQTPIAPAKTPCVIDSETLRRLQDYAMRTTVAASEASRAGAGAATTDND